MLAAGCVVCILNTCKSCSHSDADTHVFSATRPIRPGTDCRIAGSTANGWCGQASCKLATAVAIQTKVHLPVPGNNISGPEGFVLEGFVMLCAKSSLIHISYVTKLYFILLGTNFAVIRGSCEETRVSRANLFPHKLLPSANCCSSLIQETRY